jgi:hypothetical protein
MYFQKRQNRDCGRVNHQWQGKSPSNIVGTRLCRHFPPPWLSLLLVPACGLGSGTGSSHYGKEQLDYHQHVRPISLALHRTGPLQVLYGTGVLHNAIRAPIAVVPTIPLMNIAPICRSMRSREQTYSEHDEGGCAVAALLSPSPVQYLGVQQVEGVLECSPHCLCFLDLLAGTTLVDPGEGAAAYLPPTLSHRRLLSQQRVQPEQTRSWNQTLQLLRNNLRSKRVKPSKKLEITLLLRASLVASIQTIHHLAGLPLDPEESNCC